MLQVVAKDQCNQILLFQPSICTKERCHSTCKESGTSNEHDQCLPRENAKSPNGKSQDNSGEVSNEDWDVPPVEIEDDGYDGDEEDNVKKEPENVMAHKHGLLHDGKVQRHLLMQGAELLPEKKNYQHYDYSDSNFEVQSEDDSEDECCCAPNIPG